jgi:RimJ/RimL family protein N-acetyltransferase
MFPRLVRTERLILRAWEPADAQDLKSAIDANLAHLQPWVPWAKDEPSPLDAIVSRLEKFASDFASGAEWLYAIFGLDGRTLLGGTGLHPRIGPGGIELGYWIGAPYTRLGYATEAAGALTRLAFTEPEVQRVEIRCDPLNEASARIPHHLGFRHVETLVGEFVTPTGAPRDTMVWRMTRTEHEKTLSTVRP